LTPERLDELKHRAITNGSIVKRDITDLIAEIRRLWKVRDAARELRPLLTVGPLEDRNALVDPTVPSDYGWAVGLGLRLDELDDALAAYDAEAKQ
jgi:hypothetical protein